MPVSTKLGEQVRSCDRKEVGPGRFVLLHDGQADVISYYYPTLHIFTAVHFIHQHLSWIIFSKVLSSSKLKFRISKVLTLEPVLDARINLKEIFGNK